MSNKRGKIETSKTLSFLGSAAEGGFAFCFAEGELLRRDTALTGLIAPGRIMRLTPDSRAPAHLGLCRAGSCLSLSLSPILSKVKLSGAHLGPRLGQVVWSMLGTSWAQVEPMLGLGWPMLGLCWPYAEPSWRLCWAYVGDMLAILGLCWGYVRQFMLKKSSDTTVYDFFLPTKQKPWKNRRFLTWPR